MIDRLRIRRRAKQWAKGIFPKEPDRLPIPLPLNFSERQSPLTPVQARAEITYQLERAANVESLSRTEIVKLVDRAQAIGYERLALELQDNFRLMALHLVTRGKTLSIPQFRT